MMTSLMLWSYLFVRFFAEDAIYTHTQQSYFFAEDISYVFAEDAIYTHTQPDSIEPEPLPALVLTSTRGLRRPI